MSCLVMRECRILKSAKISSVEMLSISSADNPGWKKRERAVLFKRNSRF